MRRGRALALEEDQLLLRSPKIPPREARLSSGEDVVDAAECTPSWTMDQTIQGEIKMLGVVANTRTSI